VNENNGWAFFLLGVGVGVGLGIVFAPRSGSEVRGLIKDKALEGGDYIKRRTEDIRDTAGDLVDKSKSAVVRQKDQLSAAVDAGKQAYREAISSTAAESQGAAEPAI